MNQERVIEMIENLASALAKMSKEREDVLANGDDILCELQTCTRTLEQSAQVIAQALAPLARIATVVETLRAEVLSLSLQNVEKALAEKAEQNDR